MADTQLTQTGTQVQADLDKVEGLADIKTIGNGLSLSSAGELSASGSGLQLYLHKIKFSLTSESNYFKSSNCECILLSKRATAYDAYDFTYEVLYKLNGSSYGSDGTFMGRDFILLAPVRLYNLSITSPSYTQGADFVTLDGVYMDDDYTDNDIDITIYKGYSRGSLVDTSIQRLSAGSSLRVSAITDSVAAY